MTPDELDAIEARAAAATPGPWAAEDERHGKGSCSCCGEVLYAWNIVAPSREVVVSAMDDVTPGVHGDADATFIAHARTDVPALITALREAWAEAEVEQLRRQRDALRDEVAELRERAVDLIVSRGVDPKDPEGVTLRIEGNGQAWDFKVANFTRYTTPPKWDITRRAERAEAAIARVEALCDEAGAQVFAGSARDRWLDYEDVSAAIEGQQ
jgi:hypothetical protein